jgi:hypothetical protein
MTYAAGTTPAPKANPDEYNGWTNRETWLVHLWLSNEQHSDTWARELCRAEVNEHAAAHELSSQIEEYMDLPTTGFTCDLINAALARCDWREVAIAFREE